MRVRDDDDEAAADLATFCFNEADCELAIGQKLTTADSIIVLQTLQRPLL